MIWSLLYNLEIKKNATVNVRTLNIKFLTLDCHNFVYVFVHFAMYFIVFDLSGPTVFNIHFIFKR